MMKSLYKKILGATGIIYVSHIVLHFLFPLTLPHLVLDLLTLVPVGVIFVIHKYRLATARHSCNCDNCNL
jgi:branched-subunit amino acid transport protein